MKKCSVTDCGRPRALFYGKTYFAVCSVHKDEIWRAQEKLDESLAALPNIKKKRVPISTPA